MEKKYKNLIEKSIVKYHNKRTFTGCSLGLSSYNKMENEKHIYHVGSKGVDMRESRVDNNTFFDLASLTKPLVTVLSLLSLIESKKIYIKQTLEEIFTDIHVPQEKKTITLKQLISHRSGLPAHKPYYKNINKEALSRKKKSLLSLIMQEPLVNKPGCKYVYSDIDYMLLGLIIEKVSCQYLDEYWKEKITEPLGITNKFYTYNLLDKPQYDNFVETGNCSWSAEKLRGLVNDDNCRAFGRLSGHAGLFATMEGVLLLCESILLQLLNIKKHPSVSSSALHYFITKRKQNNWALGFDTVTGDCPSSGRFFSKETIGHLGYTGTSFWMDLQKKVLVVLLTNRVVYGNNTENIKEMRPYIHDKVMTALGLGE